MGVAIPTMGELWSSLGQSQNRQEKYRDKHNIYFCIGFSHYWQKPLHCVFKYLLTCFNLLWLRVRLLYHCFTNLCELFQAKLTKKLNWNILSLDFMDRNCNCSAATKIQGQCPYNGICQKTCMVHSAMCRLCNSTYIGNTQQTLK